MGQTIGYEWFVLDDEGSVVERSQTFIIQKSEAKRQMLRKMMDSRIKEMEYRVVLVRLELLE